MAHEIQCCILMWATEFNVPNLGEMFSRHEIQYSNNNTHERALGMVKAGLEQYQITQCFNLHKSTISRFAERY